jgi:hypothetical protein
MRNFVRKGLKMRHVQQMSPAAVVELVWHQLHFTHHAELSAHSALREVYITALHRRAARLPRNDLIQNGH